jgi:superoxide dismutase, Fe-Mn family
MVVQDADGTAGEDQPDRADAITEQEHRRGSSQGPSLGGELWGGRPTSKLINQWAADHTHSLAGATPVLALDMYEHSYHMDYGAAAAKYVDAFMDNIHWAHVAQLHRNHAR